MPHRSTDVYRYLIFLQKYLIGDLEVFHKISKEAEENERKSVIASQNRGCLSLFKRRPSTGTTSATITTTKYPHSFEFHFGDPLISRLTIPVTTTLFSTIDTLGFLTRNGVDYGKTVKNFTEFFAYPSTAIHSTAFDVLLNIYRHGITHNYYPKLNVEISYHSTNPINDLFFKTSLGALVLNVNKLESIVVDRLNEIINDASLYPNMNTQLSIMTTDYLTISSGKISSLLARL